jgi:hypothetical protein
MEPFLHRKFISFYLCMEYYHLNGSILVTLFIMVETEK